MLAIAVAMVATAVARAPMTAVNTALPQQPFQ
jgi:hypothetical protein